MDSPFTSRHKIASRFSGVTPHEPLPYLGCLDLAWSCSADVVSSCNESPAMFSKCVALDACSFWIRLSWWGAVIQKPNYSFGWNFWASVLIIIYCQKMFLWWELRNTLIYGYKDKNSGGSFILYLLSRIVVLGSAVGPRTYPATDFFKPAIGVRHEFHLVKWASNPVIKQSVTPLVFALLFHHGSVVPSQLLL